jgi:hypothetical protein
MAFSRFRVARRFALFLSEEAYDNSVADVPASSRHAVPTAVAGNQPAAAQQ